MNVEHPHYVRAELCGCAAAPWVACGGVRGRGSWGSVHSNRVRQKQKEKQKEKEKENEKEKERKRKREREKNKNRSLCVTHNGRSLGHLVQRINLR